jgi:hypothetical protein
MLRKRDELLDFMINMFGERSQPPPLDKARRVVQDILDTYNPSQRDDNRIKLHAGRAYHLLAQMSLRATASSRFIECIKAEIQSLKCYGMFIDEYTCNEATKTSEYGSEALPIRTLDALPPSVHGYTPFVMQLLCISAAFRALGNIAQATRWLRGAQWGEYLSSLSMKG